MISHRVDDTLFLFLARSFARLGSVALTYDLSSTELSTSIQGFSHLDFIPLVTGLTRVGFVFALSVTECSTLGSSSFVRSWLHTGLAALASDFTHGGSAPSSQQHACLGLALLVVGMSCLGLVFALSVIESSTLGLLLFPRSFARLSSVVLALQFTHLGSPLFLRGMTYLGFLSLTSGVSRLSSSSLILDAVNSESALLIRSFAHLEPVLLIADLSHFNFALLAHSFARVGFIPLLFGLARVGLVFSLSIVDCADMGLLLLVQSMV